MIVANETETVKQYTEYCLGTTARRRRPHSRITIET